MNALAPRIDVSQFSRWGFAMTGWFTSPHELEERAGVYVIATQGFQAPLVLDVGESANVRFCVLNHDRRTLWRRNALGGVYYAVLYTEHDESEFLSAFYRQNIEHHIRQAEQPVFGADDLLTRHDTTTNPVHF